jgi:DNA-binding NtrC family response regulator
VRLVAATNKPLEDEIKAGRFREDLYYRLNVVTVQLAPLRERRQDIPELIEHFLTTRQVGLSRCRVSPEAMKALIAYEWPGNVRELANVIERAQILAENEMISVDDLPETLATPAAIGTSQAPANPNYLDEVERKHILAVLQEHQWNKVHAARALGVSRRALYRLVERYGLEATRAQTAAGPQQT